MRGGRFRADLAATVLVSAVYSTDMDACQRYGVSIRSLQNWRKRLAEDEQFARLFATKSAEASKAWSEQMPIALKKCLDFLADAADALRSDPVYRRNPLVIQAVAGAMKLIADVHLTSRVLDARLANPDRSENGIPQQIPAGQQSVEYPN